MKHTKSYNKANADFPARKNLQLSISARPVVGMSYRKSREEW